MRLLRFTAEWCGPCRTIGPAVDNLAGLYGVPVDVVDVDASPAAAESYGITGVPTFVLTDDLGDLLYRGTGAPAVKQLATVLAGMQ